MKNNEEINIEENKKNFIDIFKSNIKREGSEKFLQWLNNSDFFTAPASAKMHSAFSGGLCLHSMNVYNRLLDELKLEYGDKWEDNCSLESATIMGLFHDLCKVNTFVIETRNVKEYHIDGQKQDSRGRFDWVEKELYTVDDSL